MTDFIFGTDAGFTDNANASKNWLVIFQYTTLLTGNVTEIKVKVGDNVNVKAGVYADSEGEPGELLSSEQTGTACTTGWNAITIPTLFVTKGEVYWLALNSSDDHVRYSNVVGGPSERLKSLAYTTAWPDPAGSGYESYTYNLGVAAWGTLRPTAGGSFLYNLI